MAVVALPSCVLLFAHGLWAAPRQVDDYQWDGVDRIVAIGDVHGDYDNYIAVLQLAGIVDGRGRWIAGDTHLVQTGDIADRGGAIPGASSVTCSAWPAKPSDRAGGCTTCWATTRR